MNRLMATIVHTAEYYSKEISETVLKMYIEDLSDLDADACIQAYNLYRRDPKNKTFPLPAQIREMVSPAEHISHEVSAREIAARIVGAVTKHGWANPRDAQASIGPDGWDVVNMLGGWSHLCESMNTRTSGMFQAQVRDILEGRLKYGAQAIDAKVKELPRREPAQLEKPNWTKRLLGERDED